LAKFILVAMVQLRGLRMTVLQCAVTGLCVAMSLNTVPSKVAASLQAVGGTYIYMYIYPSRIYQYSLMYTIFFDVHNSRPLVNKRKHRNGAHVEAI